MIYYTLMSTLWNDCKNSTFNFSSQNLSLEHKFGLHTNQVGVIWYKLGDKDTLLLLFFYVLDCHKKNRRTIEKNKKK